jgi:hypothetical protein
MFVAWLCRVDVDEQTLNHNIPDHNKLSNKSPDEKSSGLKKFLRDSIVSLMVMVADSRISADNPFCFLRAPFVLVWFAS